MRIRRLCDAQPLGDIDTLPLDQAADLIAQGQAEPEVNLQDHNPPVPAEGLSLAEAFDIFVDRHPDLTQYGNARLADSAIALQQYVEPPTWSDTSDLKTLCRLAGLEPLAARAGQGRHGGQGPRVIRLGEFERELASQLRRFVSSLVVHHFVRGLLDGHLRATGVWEGDLATLERQTVPSDWWKRDIVAHLRNGEIWERPARDHPPGLRRWSAVQVMPSDADAVETSAPLFSGAPGRPSSMHLIKREIRRRAKLGLLESSLNLESEALAIWLEEAYPEAHPTAPKTIQNRLRYLYRFLKNEMSS